MPNPTKLQAHLIEHTFLGCANFICYVCNAIFTVSSGLQQHILEHNNIMKPYICIKCKMQFFFRAELENHMYVHQTKSEHQVYNLAVLITYKYVVIKVTCHKPLKLFHNL